MLFIRMLIHSTMRVHLAVCQDLDWNLHTNKAVHPLAPHLLTRHFFIVNAQSKPKGCILPGF